MEKQTDLTEQQLEQLVCKIYGVTKDELKDVGKHMSIMQSMDWSRHIGDIKKRCSTAFEIFAEYFENIDEFYSFIFEMDSTEIWDFFNIMHYYHQSTELGTKGFYTVELVMIFSVIERLMSGIKEYIDLKEWMVANENKDKYKQYLPLTENNINEQIEEINKVYKKEFGSRQKAREFFNKHLTDENQEALIQGFKYYNPKYSITLGKPFGMVPEPRFSIEIGHKKTSFINGNKIIRILKNAPEDKNISLSDKPTIKIRSLDTWSIEDVTGEYFIKINKNRIDVYVEHIKPRNINEVVEIMYDIRNQFVHDAQIFRIRTKPKSGKYKDFIIDPIISPPELKKIITQGLSNFYEFDKNANPKPNPTSNQQSIKPAPL